METRLTDSESEHKEMHADKNVRTRSDLRRKRLQLKKQEHTAVAEGKSKKRKDFSLLEKYKNEEEDLPMPDLQL